MSLPITYQLFSLRDDLSKDTAGTLKRLSEMGYDGVETAGFYDLSAAEFAALCSDAGLDIVSAHISYEEFLPDRIDAAISDIKALGCEFGVVPYAQFSDETIENILAAGKKLRENGLWLLYHNHDFEFEKIDGKMKYDVLMERVGQYVGTEIDTGWAMVSGLNPAALVQRFTGNAPVVHIKDFYMTAPLGNTNTAAKNDEEKAEMGFEFRPAGDGMLDIPAIAAAAEKAGAKYLVIEQDNPSMGMTPLESAARSIENIRKLGL